MYKAWFWLCKPLSLDQLFVFLCISDVSPFWWFLLVYLVSWYSILPHCVCFQNFQLMMMLTKLTVMVAEREASASSRSEFESFQVAWELLTISRLSPKLTPEYILCSYHVWFILSVFFQHLVDKEDEIVRRGGGEIPYWEQLRMDW